MPSGLVGNHRQEGEGANGPRVRAAQGGKGRQSAPDCLEHRNAAYSEREERVKE